jgi:hypothetical protein
VNCDAAPADPLASDPAQSNNGAVVGDASIGNPIA